MHLRFNLKLNLNWIFKGVCYRSMHLLQNIVNNYDADDPSRGIIVDALNYMVDIARHINEVKRQHERLSRTEELQSALALGWSKGVQKIGFGELILEVLLADSLVHGTFCNTRQVYVGPRQCIALNLFYYL